MKKLDKIDFYFVTDSSLSRNGILSDVKAAVKAGCKIVQYREKNKSTRDMIKAATKIKKLCKKDVIFLVNDRLDVALAVNADGVHLGQEDMDIEIARKLLGSEKIIGLTVHNSKEAIFAEKSGADYIGLSPIFATNTKGDAGKACGIEMIKKARKAVKIPIAAIGGINKGNIREVVKAGADSAAAISAILCSDDVFKEVSKFKKSIMENKIK